MVLTEDDVRTALRQVDDPHFNVSLHDMGMIRRVDVSDFGDVAVSIVYPCMGCPAWDLIQNDIKERIAALAGVRSVRVKVDWANRWARHDMSQLAKDKAAMHGYRI